MFSAVRGSIWKPWGKQQTLQARESISNELWNNPIFHQFPLSSSAAPLLRSSPPPTPLSPWLMRVFDGFNCLICGVNARIYSMSVCVCVWAVCTYNASTTYYVFLSGIKQACSPSVQSPSPHTLYLQNAIYYSVDCSYGSVCVCIKNFPSWWSVFSLFVCICAQVCVCGLLLIFSEIVWSDETHTHTHSTLREPVYGDAPCHYSNDKPSKEITGKALESEACRRLSLT